MKTDEIKTLTDVVNELSESYVDLATTLTGTSAAAKRTKSLWKNGKKSPLIKIGLALIAFPDPTISDIVGSAFVAAGLVQEGIKRQTVHVEDVVKTFHNTMKDLRSLKQEI